MKSNLKALLFCALVASLAACDQTVDVGGTSGSSGTSNSSSSGGTSSSTSSGSSGSSNSGTSTSGSSASSGSSGGTSSGSSGSSGSTGGAIDDGFGDWRIVSSGDFADITSVWGDAPGDFWACSSEGGLLHFDGTEWALTSARAPIRGTRQTQLTNIKGSGPNDIWVQGDIEGVVGHFDGGAWSFSTVDGASGAPGSQIGLEGDALWVKGPDDVWVAGRIYDGGDPEPDGVFHFDGSSWSPVAAPAVNDYVQLGGTPGTNGELWLASSASSSQGVLGGAWRYTGSFTPEFQNLSSFSPTQLWVFGASDAWFGDTSSLRHWDGTQLTTDSPSASSPDGLIVSGLWGTGSTLWAVGEGAFRRENGSWQELPTYVDPDVSLRTVWGSSANDIWACGNSYDFGQCAHFDGTAWKPMSTGTGYSRSAIFAASDGSVWSADSNFGMVRLQAGVWTVEPAPPPAAGGATGIDAVWGDSSSDLWAVTGNDIDGNSSYVSSDSAAIIHFDGSSWTQERATTAYEELLDVWGSGPDDVWAVGSKYVGNSGNNVYYDPILVQRDASGWSDVSVSGSGELDALLGFSSADVWAVGSSGSNSRILHNAGSGWSDWPGVPAGLALRTIAGASASDIWAGGDGATLMHFDGSAWTTVSAPFTDGITALAVADGKLHVATVDGADATARLWTYDGSSWTQDTAFPWRVNRMITQGSRIWAVGRSGLIARLH